MKNKILESSLWMLGGGSLQQILQFVIFILLARYLSPEVFGQVAMAAIVCEVASAIGRWGVGEILMQRRRMTSTLLSHCFVFCLFLSIAIISLLLTGIAIYAYFYGWNLFCKLVALLCPVIILQSFEIIPETLLRKNFSYKWLAIRGNLSATIGGLIAVGLAIEGFGVYALVVQRLASSLVMTIAVNIAMRNKNKVFSAAHFRPALLKIIASTGFHLVSAPLAVLVGPRLSDTLVAVFYGPASLGHLRITRRVFDMIAQVTISPISNVSQAAFSAISSDLKALEVTYKSFQGNCAAGVFPLFAGVALLAPFWVPLLLGDKWHESIHLIQYLSLAAVPAVVNYFQNPLLIVSRRNKIISIQNAIRIISSVALTLVAIPFGIKTVVILFVLQGYAFMIANLLIIKSVFKWSLVGMVVNLWPPLFSSLTTMGVLTMITFLFPDLTGFLALATLGATGAILYSGMMVLLFRKKLRRV